MMQSCLFFYEDELPRALNFIESYRQRSIPLTSIRKEPSGTVEGRFEGGVSFQPNGEFGGNAGGTSPPSGTELQWHHV